MNNQTISIIVPFLNEEKNLPILYQRIISVFENIKEQLEIVFIDDGSHDQSLKWVKLIAAENSNVKYIKLSRNFGHQRAITAGMNHCTGDAAIIIDADLQDPPEVIKDLIEKWKDGYEVVVRKRERCNRNLGGVGIPDAS